MEFPLYKGIFFEVNELRQHPIICKQFFFNLFLHLNSLAKLNFPYKVTFYFSYKVTLVIPSYAGEAYLKK